VRGDPDRLHQAFWNLLTNAVKFTPNGGTITAALARRGGAAEVTITDTGIGIPAEFLPQLFERFTQHESGAKREFGGLGLGLALVRYFIELHGGTVHAESAGEGKGATFRTLIPLAPDPSPA
jgi:signal transduction histidine kinase